VEEMIRMVKDMWVVEMVKEEVEVMAAMGVM
jgi:hypothetical protein